MMENCPKTRFFLGNSMTIKFEKISKFYRQIFCLYFVFPEAPTLKTTFDMTTLILVPGGAPGTLFIPLKGAPGTLFFVASDRRSRN